MIISDLQLNLIAAGAAAVAAVWGYNLWQEQKQRKAGERMFREVSSAASESGPEPEPDDGHDLTADVDLDDGRIEPVIDAGVEGDAAEPDETLADAMIEWVLALHFPRSIPGSRMLALSKGLDGRLTRRHRLIVQNEAGEWQAQDVEGSISGCALRATLPLADRQGALGRAELLAFQAAIQSFACELGGKCSAPDIEECLAQAKTLDDFCASVDVQVAVHVLHRTGNDFSCARLGGLLENSGLKLAADGGFYLFDETGAQWFSLSNHGAAPFVAEDMPTALTHGVTFWLDVPRAPQDAQVFERMVQVARQLAHELDGVLVDDQRNPLTDSDLASIRARVTDIQAKMADAGLPAGGRRALQLFV